MMHAGFLRGRDDATGMTLAQATENMYRSGAYMRVYWEGTAIMLMADVRLRQMTAGKQSLDTALAALNECCSSPDRSWSAGDLMGKLDEITGTGVFRELYDIHIAAVDFPELAATYRALGIVPHLAGIEFSADARERGLREAIMETGVLITAEVPEQ
jgi:predicted metalloprotease with PDZ domain